MGVEGERGKGRRRAKRKRKIRGVEEGQTGSMIGLPSLRIMSSFSFVGFHFHDAFSSSLCLFPLRLPSSSFLFLSSFAFPPPFDLHETPAATSS
jgi:hypothetical protein